MTTRILVTGGAGFIGSHYVRTLLGPQGPGDVTATVLDKLTYAGNPANLADVEHDPRYAFVHGDIGDAKLVRDVARGMDAIVNFAAPSHVDRSILDPDEFLKTNVLGEPIAASPAIVRGRIYIRGDKHLYAIGGGAGS